MFSFNGTTGNASTVMMSTYSGMRTAIRRENRRSSCNTNKYISHMTQAMAGPATAEYQAFSKASSRLGSTYCRLQMHQAMQDSARKRYVRSLRRDHQNMRKNKPIANKVTLHATGMTICKNSRIASLCDRALAGPTLTRAKP